VAAQKSGDCYLSTKDLTPSPDQLVLGIVFVEGECTGGFVGLLGEVTVHRR